MKSSIIESINQSKSRFQLWFKFINALDIESVGEIGVYRGDFAAEILRNSSSIKKYYMIDPWRNIEGRNSPTNKDNETFNKFY